MKKCKNCLKYYDENVSRECPYCEMNHPQGENLFPSNHQHTQNEKTILYSPTEITSTQESKGENKSSTKERVIETKNEENHTIAISNLNSQQSSIEPVVGWLIVVKGEGMGSDLRIVPGMNTLGRGAENKIVLDYGDHTISSSHATIIYDYRNNIFFFQHGGGTNLSYVNNSVVLQPIELKNGDTIGIGNTELMFVPLCTEEFKWDK